MREVFVIWLIASSFLFAGDHAIAGVSNAHNNITGSHRFTDIVTLTVDANAMNGRSICVNTHGNSWKLAANKSFQIFQQAVGLADTRRSVKKSATFFKAEAVESLSAIKKFKSDSLFPLPVELKNQN